MTNNHRDTSTKHTSPSEHDQHQRQSQRDLDRLQQHLYAQHEQVHRQTSTRVESDPCIISSFPVEGSTMQLQPQQKSLTAEDLHTIIDSVLNILGEDGGDDDCVI